MVSTQRHFDIRRLCIVCTFKVNGA